MKSFDRIQTYTTTTARELYEKGFSDSFHNSEQIRGKYLKFTTDCIMKKYGTRTATTQVYSFFETFKIQSSIRMLYSPKSKMKTKTQLTCDT